MRYFDSLCKHCGLLLFDPLCVILKKLKCQFYILCIVKCAKLSIVKTIYLPIIIFLCVFLEPLASSAQDVRMVDSLKSILETQSSKDRYATLIQLTIQYVDKDNNISLGYVEKASQNAIESADTSRIVNSGRIKGQILRRLDRIEEAIALFNNLLPIAKRNSLGNDYKAILNSLALAYTEMANYDKALECHFQSLVIREREGNNQDISISLFNIGLVYYKLNNFEHAINYYNKALRLKREINYLYDIDLLLINIGHCYNSLQKFDLAREYILEALKICGKECPEYKVIDAEYGLGASFFFVQEYDNAKKHFKRALSLSESASNIRLQADNLLMLGRIAIAEGNADQAVELLTRAEQLAQNVGYNRILIDVLRQFSILYKEQKNFELASFYQDKYIHLKDSIISDGLIKNLASVQTKIEERENIKIIATKDEELWQQRQLNIAVATIALLAGLLVFLLYKINAARRKANERLDKEVQDATRDLREAYKLLAEVNKELDHFIYKTSHDIRGPLASLKGLCNVALADVGDPTALGYFSKIDLTASHLDTLLRRLQKINQINHATPKRDLIDFAGIVHEVEQMERDKGMPSNLSITYQIQPDIQFFSDNELIYLVLENLIDNAIKFHDPSKANPFVIITISTADQLLKIKVIDNGIGIGQADPEQLFQMFVRATERSASGGIGLYLSRRATEKLGGEIHMCTTPEGYTEFYVILPLEINML
jgi:signal transduction histidine kinase